MPGGWTKLVNGHVLLAQAPSPPAAFDGGEGRSLLTLRRVSGFLVGSKPCDRRPINGADPLGRSRGAFNPRCKAKNGGKARYRRREGENTRRDVDGPHSNLPPLQSDKNRIHHRTLFSLGYEQKRKAEAIRDFPTANRHHSLIWLNSTPNPLIWPNVLVTSVAIRDVVSDRPWKTEAIRDLRRAKEKTAYSKGWCANSTDFGERHVEGPLQTAKSRPASHAQRRNREAIREIVDANRRHRGLCGNLVG